MGHLIKIAENDNKIDVELCAECLRRKIAYYFMINRTVPREMLELCASLERGE